MRLKIFPLFFSVILFVSLVGFAASLSVSAPQLLGSGSADVEAPGVEVISVDFTLDPSDPSKVKSATAKVRSTTGAVLTDMEIYFLVKDAGGGILGKVTVSDGVPPSPDCVELTIWFSPYPLASGVASVAVTVVPV